MRSEITNIQVLAKGGAFGRRNATGIYIYGKRRDGRTVPCRSEEQPDGGMQIYSCYDAGGQFLEEDMTEFTADEWKRVRAANGHAARHLANQILNARKDASG